MNGREFVKELGKKARRKFAICLSSRRFSLKNKYMHCVYVIQNSFSKEIYIGKTDKLERRLKEHNAGEQTSTRRKSGKWILVYAEAYRVKLDADRRERALKQHGSNKRWLMNRISSSLLTD